MGGVASCVLPQSPAADLPKTQVSTPEEVEQARQLLRMELKVLVKHRFQHDNTLLHEIVRNGNQGLLQVAVEVVQGSWAAVKQWAGSPHAGSEAEVVARFVNSRNIKGQTPLMLAARYKQAKTIPFLLANGADPWAFDGYGCGTALHQAALQGSVECVSAILENVPEEAPDGSTGRGRRHLINCHTSAGFTPLHYATARGHTEVVKLLLSYGASINCSTARVCWSVTNMAKFDVGSTALHMAAFVGDAATANAILRHHASAVNSSTSSLGVVPFDPRCYENRLGRMPLDLVDPLKHPRLSNLLLPTTDLQALYFPVDSSRHRAELFPTLASLAAAALHSQLLSDIAAVERTAAGAGETETPAGSFQGYWAPNPLGTDEAGMDEEEALCGICLEARAAVVPTRPGCASSGHAMCCGCALHVCTQAAQAEKGQQGSKHQAAQCPFCRESIPGFRAVVHM